MVSDSEVEFYQHSGKPGNSVTTILLLGIPVAVAMAAIYSYLVVYVPLIGYINILFLGGYVFGTGYVLSRLAKMGKSRSEKMSFALGCLVGAVGLYAAWLFFFKAIAGENFPLLEYASHPQEVWEIAKALNAEGWWEGGPTGIFGWIVSGLEAVTFVLGCGLITMISIDCEVFCERCNHWCEPAATQNLKITEEFASAMEAERKSAWKHFDILKLPKADLDEYPRFVGEVLTCTGCGNTSAIRLQLLSIVNGENGPEESSKALPGILLLANDG